MKLEAKIRLQAAEDKGALRQVANTLATTFNLKLKYKKSDGRIFTATVEDGPYKATMLPRMDRQYGKGKKQGNGDVYQWKNEGVTIKLSFALPPREALNNVTLSI